MKKALLLVIFFSLSAMAFGKQQTEKQLPAKMGGTLDLKLETGGSVRIEGWDQELFHAVVRSNGRDAEYAQVDFSETVSGIRIRSGYRGPKTDVIQCNLVFEIKLPYRFNVTLDSMGGGLTVRSLEGVVRGKTLGGELDLSNIKGEINLTTNGGAVILKDSQAEGKITTFGGPLRFENVRGGIKGFSAGGEMIMRNVETSSGEKLAVGDEVNIKSHGGDFNIQTAPRGASVETLGGNIRIGEARGFVRAITNGGNITVGSVDGWVKARTNAGDITINVTGLLEESGDEKNIELSSNHGDLRLALPSNLSAVFELEVAYTINSSQNFKIVSDFDLNRENTEEWDYSRGTPLRYLRGHSVIGGGRHRIKLRTINGNIYLKRGD